MSIDHSKKVLEDVTHLVNVALVVLRDGLSYGGVAELFGVLEDIKNIATEAPSALPELVNLSAEDAGQLATASYEMVRQILSTLGTSK